MYPIMLDLRDRACLVVGAGQVAHRKLVGLLAEGARVTVVAPTAIEPIATLSTQGTVTWHQRPFAAADVQGSELVFVATGKREVDQQVVDAARKAGVWVNVADVPELCDFYLPSRVQRGDLQIAIASAGSAPFAVRRLRQLLDAKFGPEWSEWIAASKAFRKVVLSRGLEPAAADACFDRWIEETVDEATLAVRVPTAEEQDAWIAKQREASAGAAPRPGQVALVGAGPGNPGLLTIRGMELLRKADAVVYDRLAIPAIPLDLPDHIELISVGKEAGHHPVPQEEINELLLRLAREGKRVVRLKGGDPFVFARGGEEALVLRSHGIPCEVVPGVTAGIAAPAAAGIPVTYRREAVRLIFVTAHEGGTPQVRWDLLAQDAHATLVGYMGVSNLAEVSASLMAAGMSGQTPAALIEHATLPQQRSLRTSLADLPAAAEKAGIKSPAIFVIGTVVGHADALADQAVGPLRGMRLGVSAPKGAFASALETAGAAVLTAPKPLTAAARLVLGSAPLSGWLVRDAADLDALEREKRDAAFLGQTPLLCVGADLAAMARTRQWSDVTALDGSEDVQRVATMRRKEDSR
jgi:uroporphyrin-III C-methyltransferase / precorrin-2 dehydrogenase / sirohydrochlorin ferrochelatase